MKPDFSDIDFERFNKYIKDSDSYLEFGSGGSTYVFMKQYNQKNIYVIESDLYWTNKIEESLGQKIKNLIYVDINSSPNTYGRPDNTPPAGSILPVLPANEQKKKQWANYSDSFLKIDLNDFNKIDLILIDGRFRVACCLKLFEYISDKCIIMFDDFKYREWFHECLNYFEIVDECENKESRMCILKKKKVEKPSKELIEKYEIDYR
jgi:hypothetical protein